MTKIDFLFLLHIKSSQSTRVKRLYILRLSDLNQYRRGRVNHIFDNYREIIETLVRVSQPRVSSAKSENSFHNKGNSHGLTKQSPKLQTPFKASPTLNSSPSTLENFNASTSNVESVPW